jgi:SWI/SNF-related matrix-associated actin-dependent regulator 1 of chromatin subfamily A
VTVLTINPGDRLELGLPAWIAREKGFASREVTGTVLAVTQKAVQVRAHVMVRECETCLNCGRAIDSPASRLLGFGPVCSDNLGLPHAETYAAMSPAEREAIRNRVQVETTVECWLPRKSVVIRSHEQGAGDERAASDVPQLSGGGGHGAQGRDTGRALLATESQSESTTGGSADPVVPVEWQAAAVARESTTPNLDRFLGIQPAAPGEPETPEQFRARWAKVDAYLRDPERVAEARASWENAAGQQQAPPDNPRRVEWAAPAYRILFPFNADVLSAVKRIPGARWSPEGKDEAYPDKHWMAPAGAGVDVLRFAAEHGFQVSADAAAQAESARSVADQNLAESRAAEAEFHVEGLGGTLRPFQCVGAAYLVRVRRAILADEMRLGKSPTSLAVCLATQALPALFVVPATLKAAWRREAERWLPGRTVAVLDGKAPREPANWVEWEPLLAYAKRYEAWARECRRQIGAAEVLIINYDILMDWAGVRWTTNERWRRVVGWCGGPLAEALFRALVCDEFHKHVIGRKAQRTLVLQHLAADWRRRGQERDGFEMVQLLLSGTPMKKEAADLLQPLQIIDRLDDFGGFYGFATKFCGYSKGVMGMVAVPPAALAELNTRLRSTCMVRRRRADVFTEIPKVQRHVVPFAIDNRAEYDRAERDVIGWAGEQALKDREFNESLAGLDPEARKAARAARRKDAGEVAARAEGLVRISALKKLAAYGKMAAATEWIANYLEESGEKLIVGAWHQEVVEEIARRFRVPFIHGGVTAAKKDAAVHAFQRCAACGERHEAHLSARGGCEYVADQRTPLISINFKSGGMGLTLTAANDTAVMELGWTPDDMDQFEMRVGHIDKQDPANHWYLLAENTIEEDIAAVLDERRRQVNAVTDGESRADETGIMEALLERMAARAVAT